MKDTILRRYDITEETYRQKFRVMKKGDNESYRELSNRLQDMATKWFQECDSVEDVLDFIAREQLLSQYAYTAYGEMNGHESCGL